MIFDFFFPGHMNPAFNQCARNISIHVALVIYMQNWDQGKTYLRNTKCDLVMPRMRTAYGQNSFAFHGVDTWNKLHSDIKLAPSIQSFKAKLKTHN